MADVKRVYTFGNKEAEGNGKMRELLGQVRGCDLLRVAPQVGEDGVA